MHLKVTQPFMCFWLNQVYLFLSQINIFINSPRWIFISSPVGFVISPLENLLLGLTPEKFWKFEEYQYQYKLSKRGIFSNSIIKKLLQIMFSWTLKDYYWIASLRKLQFFFLLKHFITLINFITDVTWT